MLVLGGCGDSGAPDQPTPEEIAAPADPASIPVEALPNPLPEPVIIRDDGVTVEEERRDEILYIVQPGDSLGAIAAFFEVDPTELQRINGIVDPSVLRAGDELRVPVQEGTESERIAASQDTDEIEPIAPPPGEEYVVQPGDNLYEIGLVFGVSYLELQSYNRLTEFESVNLQVGQTIIIPPAANAEEEGSSEPPG
jgi:LysM repeat protein